jgi:hypothetical protein
LLSSLLLQAKFITAASIQSIRKRAAEVDTDVRKVRGQAKQAQQANGLAGRGVNTKARKKSCWKSKSRNTGKNSLKSRSDPIKRV